MIKRTLATAFLMLSGILFLAHAVIPHHHHGNRICFVKSHCANDDPEGDQGNKSDNHTHDGEDGSAVCIFKDPAVVSSNQLTGGLKFIKQNSCQPGFLAFHPGLLPDTRVFHNPVIAYFDPVYRTGYFYTSPSLASPALRAPPAV